MVGGADMFALAGDAGNDTLDGGAGSDRVSGGAGNDMLYGGDAAASFEDFINSHDAIEPSFMRLSANDSGLQRKRSTDKLRSRCRPDRFDKMKSRMHTKTMTKHMERTLSC